MIYSADIKNFFQSYNLRIPSKARFAYFEVIVLLIQRFSSLGLSQGDDNSGGFSPEAGKFIGAGLAVGLAGFGSSIGMVLQLLLQLEQSPKMKKCLEQR